MMTKLNKKLTYVLLACFMLVFAFQVSFDIEEAAALNVNMIRGSIEYVKTGLIYPYLAVFISMDVMAVNPSASEGGTSRAPAKERSGKNSFSHSIFYTLLNIIIVSSVMKIMGLSVFRGSGFRKRIFSRKLILHAYRVKWLEIYCMIRKVKILSTVVYVHDKFRSLYWKTLLSLSRTFRVRFFLFTKAVKL